MKLIFDLLQQMSVFLVIAYLFSKSPAFRPLTGEELRGRHKLLLYVIFSTFSILGTYFGLPVHDAIANTRAIGPVLAGIIGGPLLGVTTGLTGGLHRYTLGGFTAFSCGVSTTVEGLLGGLVHLYLVRNGKADRIFSPGVALATTFVAEALQMLIILTLARPVEEALDLVRLIALPMMLANSVGAALFISIIRDQRSMYDRFGALFSAKALELAERILGILGKGFNTETASAMARVIHQETGVGAVSITDREKILGFVGQGADHHLPGNPIVSPLTRQAIAENRVIYADGVHTHFRCSIADDCPLDSALVIPLQLDREVIGTIKLYEPKNKLFLKLNRTLGEGIAALLSEQLLRARFEEQKSLLVQSELKLVQAQVNPHFLFNALNTIMAVVRENGERGNELLQQLSNFFRKNLKRSGDLATLEEELEHVGSYLEIEKARFEERLTVETDVDPALLSLKIPVFTLQPIIENAVKHGISNLLDGGVVRISARREGDLAMIDIADNAGTYCEQVKAGGLGMNLVDKRVKNLYGDAYGVSVTCTPDRQTLVSITIPWQQEQAA